MKYTPDDAVDTVSHQLVNQYLCSIRKLVKDQYEQGLITMRVDDIMTNKMNDLIHIVNTRGEKNKKKHFKERVTDDFEPYRALSDIPKLETYIWNERKDKNSYGTSAL